MPNATLMVIEQAERFGLAQLHQLRGRVGRGDKASVCPCSTPRRVRDRRYASHSSRDQGRLWHRRGRPEAARCGELLGTRQSGDPGFRVARLPGDEDLLEAAREQTKYLINQDPDLTSPQGEAARLCLYLFERDEAIRLLRAG